MSPELLADIAVRARIPGVEPVFTYRVPARLRTAVRPGQLVWVPLRRQQVQGIVIDVYGASNGPTPALFRPDPGATTSPDAPTIRDVFDVADRDAALTLSQVRLARWLSEHYRTPLYETLSLMLPPGVAQEAEPTWQATAAGLSVNLGTLPEGERAVLYFLRQHGEQSERKLRGQLRGSDSELRDLYAALNERGLIVRGAAFSRPRARPRIERMVAPTFSADDLEAHLAELARAPKQQAVLAHLLELTRVPSSDEDEDDEALAEAVPVPLSALTKASGATITIIRALEERGLLVLSTREVRRDPLAGDNVPPDMPPPLTSGQERVWRDLSAAIDQLADLRQPLDAAAALLFDSQPRAAAEQATESRPASAGFLLHGVTGSGKTEVYLRAIGRAMRRGRQALVMVPEIALTAQLVRRFAARFPGKLAVLHSGLSLGERYDEWRRLRSGEAMLAIGSRSAVFAPLPNLGLIIVDEEHETSYKHDGAPRYHARDVARQLATLTGSVLVLGSATPAVESYHDATRDVLRLLRMPERVGMVLDANNMPRSRTLPLPPVEIVDMRHELQQGNRSIFSRALQDALQQSLARNEQSILFLNRRGAASFVLCRDCGVALSCPNCTTPLTLHYDDMREALHTTPQPSEPEWALLICHSCNHRELMPAACPHCWSPRIKSFGVGTQRVVEEVEKLFPQARTLRWDRDTVTRKGDHGRMLDTFLGHKADVLVGTQMIAKGLDLPLVSVVGVVAADIGLNLPDFRSGERTFQLLTQVAGRAGRRGDEARVVIQTYTPDHYALRAAQEHDYASFYQQEISFRRQTGYPPFGKLIRFVYAGGTEARSRLAAEQLADDLRALAIQLGTEDWSIIGPAPAFFGRQRNRFRWHLLLRAADPAPLLARLYIPPGWALDIDPVNVL